MINFSKVSNKSIIRMLFNFFMKFIPGNTILWIIQGKLKGKKWMIGSSVYGCLLGTYEYRKQIIFSRIIKEGSIVYDLGAYVGFYTMLASALVGSKGKVFAFEPSARNIHYLKRHLRLNHCNNVTVIESAVTDRDGVTFFEEGITSSTDHLSARGNLKVKTISLDNCVYNNKIPPPEYIKIDTEGTELLILLGAKNILINYSPTIFLTLHTSELRSQCYKFLKSINYDLRSIYENEDINNTNEALAFKRE